jgi:hypothetical protein
MPRRRRDTMGMRELKIKRFLKNTFYRKRNGNLVLAVLAFGTCIALLCHEVLRLRTCGGVPYPRGQKVHAL